MRALTCFVTVSVLVLSACGDDDTTPSPMADGGADAGASCTTADECDDGVFCNGVETCSAGACTPAATGACTAGQTCDEAAGRCVTDCAMDMDADGDGVASIDCGGMDCDDGDADTFPGNTEVCDVEGHDEDCDETTVGDRDLDGDGDVDELCCNGATCGTDCNDLQRGINASSPEVCNGYDDDCDGSSDEGVLVPSWPDADFDLHGDMTATPEDRCAGAHGFATVGDDCDDSDPQVHPAQVEICDTKDNDCDGMTDEAPAATTWYIDGDDDGFGNPDARLSRVSCVPLTGYSLRPTDCDDADPTVSPAAIERCNGADDNCNGAADYQIAPGDFEDDDGDGSADSMCPMGDDCDDRDPTSLPGAVEICDRRDNDCNGMVDDGTAMGAWYRDSDGDTYGDDSTPPMMSCDPIVGHITRGGDCDDTMSARRPGVVETCNGVDDDCDGSTDEGTVRSAFYCDQDSDTFGDGEPFLGCVAPPTTVMCPAWTNNPLDCAPTNPTIGVPGVYYPDADLDTYGDASAAPAVECTPPFGHVTNRLDCDDMNDMINPDGIETCNSIDDDCNGMIDDDPADDPMNCGMCGRACMAGESCAAGVCLGITQLVAGSAHVCALYSNGHVYCWGRSSDGETGQGMLTSTRPPGRVVLLTGAPLDDATSISTSSTAAHVCATRMGGTVVCWGKNDRQQSSTGASPVRSPRAGTVPGVSGAIDVAVGESHSCALLSTGAVRCWGDNTRGQLGNGSVSGSPITTPTTMVENDGAGGMRPIADAIDVVASRRHTCVLHMGSTRVSCAGSNDAGGGWTGVLGRGTLPATNFPVADAVALPPGTVVRSLHTNGGFYAGHTCVLPTTGRPICWGTNTYRQIASTLNGIPTPQSMDPYYTTPMSMTLGHDYTCVQYVNAAFGPRIACQGQNASGQLGQGTSGSWTPIPNDVITASGGGTFLASVGLMAAGRTFMCVTLPTGGVTCWGSNGSQVFGRSGAGRTFCDLTATVPGLP